MALKGSKNMFDSPTLWGLLPLLVFVVLVFMKWHPVIAILIATIVGALMSGNGLMSIASVTQEGMGSFLAYVGLIIMAGGGLGKIAEKTGVAQKIVSFVMDKVGVNTPSKAILGTMASSGLLTGSLGTLAGSNAVIAPVVIPIVASAGLSSSAVAMIFQGAGVTGLWLGPFTPPMIVFMEITGLSYFQIVLYASLPLAIVMWIVTYFYVKLTLPKTIIDSPYSDEDIELSKENELNTDSKVVTQATFAFLITLIGLIIYGVITQGGSTFAIIVITVTAIVTGLVGRLKPNDIAETFFKGAMPLVWLFFQFVLFTPFIFYIEELGGFRALQLILMPYLESGSNSLLVTLTAITGIAGIPGAAVAQVFILDELFSDLFMTAGIPLTIYMMVLIIGSQMTEFLYPVGDTLGAMGIARSKDLKNMIIFGVVATISIVTLIFIISLFL